jgi:hypothetical protein
MAVASSRENTMRRGSRTNMKPAKITAVIALVLGAAVVAYYAVLSHAPPLVEQPPEAPELQPNAGVRPQPPESIPEFAFTPSPPRQIQLIPPGQEVRREQRDDNEGRSQSWWLQVRGCEFAPRTLAALNARLEALRKQFAETGGVIGGQVYTLEQREAPEIASYERCKEVTQATLRQAEELIKRDAAAGDPIARSTHMKILRDAGRIDEAQAEAEAAWKEGYLIGLNALGVDFLPHKIAGLKAMMKAAPPDSDLRIVFQRDLERTRTEVGDFEALIAS